MFLDDHKKVATIIRGKRSAKGERLLDPTPMKAEVVKHENGEIDERHTAMQDFMSAHAEQSAGKMAEALANFLDIHQAMPSSVDDSEPA